MKKILILFLSILMISGCSQDVIEEVVNVEDTNKIVAEYLEKDDCYKYHYEQLSEKKKKIYEQIYMGLSKREKKISVNEASEDTVYEIIELVNYDHPELYYYTGWKIYNEEKSELRVGYLKDDPESEEVQEHLKQRLSEVQARIPEGAGNYEITKIVYDYMIERCEYVEGAENNQNILSSLVSNQTVCAGYAKGVQYLLNQLGIPCSYIVGTIINPEEGENSYHAWNMVEIDNDYYYMDATWGDIAEVAPHTCNAYFMLSQSEMLQLYVPDNETKETTSYNNYFIQNGVYLNEYNEGIISSIMVNCYNEGRNIMEIKCAPEVYENVLYQLTEIGRIYNVMYASGLNYNNLSYTTTPELNLIEIILN